MAETVRVTIDHSKNASNISLKFVEVVVLSDTHNKHESLERFLLTSPTDANALSDNAENEENKKSSSDDLPEVSARILVHCGDFAKKGSKREVEDFNNWLGKPEINSYFDHKIMVSGNHDRGVGARSQLPDVEYESMLSNIVLLKDEGINLEGIVFYGVDFTKDEDRYAAISTPCDILLTHYPPKGILDLNVNHNHSGSRQLRQAVEKLSPSVHLFGHVHEARGMLHDTKRDILYLNCANASGDKSRKDLEHPPVRIIVQLICAD